MERVRYLRAGGTVASPRAIYDTASHARVARVATIGPRYFMIGAVVILLVGFLLRVWDLGGPSLWTDEVLTAIRAQAPLSSSLESILSAGNQTPLYFLSLRLMPNFTEALLRLPSVLWGVLGIALIMVFPVRFNGDYEMGLWAGALLAVNPYHVWLSRTARQYSMVFVLALVASACFLLLVRGHRTRGVWVTFILTSAIAYFTHYTTVALLAAQYILFAFILRENRGLLRRWFGAQAIAAIPALVWLYAVSHQPLGVKSEWIPTPALRDIPLTIWNMTLGYDGVFKWYMVAGLMVVSFGLVMGVWYAARDWKTDKENLYWLWLIVAPLLPVFVMSAVVVSIYVDRYFMVFLPAVVLLMLQGWMRSAPRFVWQVALVIVLLTGAHTIVFAFYDGSYQRADWRGAANYVAEEFRPGDDILIERSNVEQAFMRYFDPHLAATSDRVILADNPDATFTPQEAPRVWVIYRNPNEDVHRIGVMPDFDPFDPTLSAMGKWLSERRSQVIAQRKFNGVRILLLDPSQPLVANPEP